MRGLALLLLGCSVACGGSVEVDPLDTDTDTEDTDSEVLPEILVDTEIYTGPIELTVDEVDWDCDALVQDVVMGMHTWSVRDACGFAVIGLGHSSGEHALQIEIGVDEDASLEVGELFQKTWYPGAGESEFETWGSLELVQGSYLDEDLCNDALMNTPTVSSTWAPIDGMMTLEVTTAADESGFQRPFVGKLSVTDVTVQLDTDNSKTCLLPDLTLEGLPLGWLPG